MAQAVEKLAEMKAEDIRDMGSRARQAVEQEYNFTALGKKLEKALLETIDRCASDA